MDEIRERYVVSSFENVDGSIHIERIRERESPDARGKRMDVVFSLSLS